MPLFSFTVQNDFSGDQEFLIEADDLIDAHMKAIDFAKQVNEKILARYDVDANLGRHNAAGQFHPQRRWQETHLREVDGMKTPPELDAIAQVVLSYRPKPKSAAAKKRTRKAKRDAQTRKNQED